MLDADRVDSVPFVGVGMAFAEEGVPKVRAAIVASSFCSRLASSESYVATVVSVETLVVGIPPAVLELGTSSVQRELAPFTPEVPCLWKVPGYESASGRERECVWGWVTNLIEY